MVACGSVCNQSVSDVRVLHGFLLVETMSGFRDTVAFCVSTGYRRIILQNTSGSHQLVPRGIRGSSRPTDPDISVIVEVIDTEDIPRLLPFREAQYYVGVVAKRQQREG